MAQNPGISHAISRYRCVDSESVAINATEEMEEHSEVPKDYDKIWFQSDKGS